MPFLCMWIFTMALSKILAIMQDKNLITVTMSRKIGTLFGRFKIRVANCFKSDFKNLSLFETL